ncbi:carbohydrate ABC transporter substrate-binding protein [Histidinibacterium lentulum]|uniref:Carbohydrate ABC transporter substrate-binding protein n=2 Tax=Histidinibacterium lentulum TaxID=2480588 RepID=A0A3N2QLL6_9RHOB|nr:carbohydrate ABC transporter substrate-binding protein [Histidinibacterium lentulum]
MTWDHSRGFDPMVATSRAFEAAHPGVTITWEKRSLQAFADRPIEEMAGRYDLMVIDHPHVGEVAGSGLLMPFDGQGREAELSALAAQSVGLSHPSYEFDGRQWSLAIDAATPVAAFRPDRLEAAPETWDGVMVLARQGRVAFALIPINALMTFMGMARNLGADVGRAGGFVDRAAGETVLARLGEIVALMDPRCLTLDPIGIYEWMGRTADAPAYSPYGYGYTNYSRAGYCRFPLIFADAPGLERADPSGTVIGGTGIAVSTASKHVDLALDYAFWIAGAECQAGLFFDAGGQPGNAVAWESDRCNTASRNFFRGTRATLESAWLRPRHDGYMGFQEKGGDIVHAFLRGEATRDATLDALEKAWAESLP